MFMYTHLNVYYVSTLCVHPVMSVVYTHDKFCMCVNVYTNSDVYVCALVHTVTSVCIYLVTS